MRFLAHPHNYEINKTCMKKKLFLSLLLVSCYSMNAQHIINVSVNGNDTHADGSLQKPYATLQKAYNIALEYQGNDTVFINLGPGIFQFEKTFTITETPKTPVVINGSKEGIFPSTYFSGGIKLGKWEKTSEGYWKTKVEETEKYGFVFEQLYVNGKRAQRAKTPDKGWFFIKETKEDIHYRGTGRFPEYSTQRFTVDPQDLKTLKGIDYESSNDVMAMFFHHWDNTRKYFSEIKPDSGYLFLNGIGLKPWNPITKGSRYILENYKSAMTVPGEWFLDKTTGDLFYIPREGEDMNSAEVYAPCVSTLLKFEGTKNSPVKNIIVRNIAFEHSAYVMPKTGNDAEQAAASIPATVHLDFAENIRFDNCLITNTGNYGFWFRRNCNNCMLTNSLLTDLGAGGVKIGDNMIPEENEVTKHIHVENNIIQKTGMVLPCGVGVAIFHSSHNKVLHNEISNLMYSGVSVGWIWGYADSYANHNEIAYNHIHHIGWGELSDMGAVYTLGKSPGTHIHHNVIHDVYSYDYGGWGLYTDEGSTGVIMENNLVYGCKSGAFHQHYGRENIIRNNIFAFGQYFQVQLTKVEEHCSFTFSNNIILGDCGVMFAGPWDKANIDMKKNLYWDLRTDNPDFLDMKFKEWKKKRDKQSVLTDPLFINPQKGDFRFKSMKHARKINFIPFDYTQAGVYGPKEWKEKAKMSENDIKRFSTIIKEREKSYSSYYGSSK